MNEECQRLAGDSMTPLFADPGPPVGQSTVGDFWRWAYSSLADNATRGVFAEYLVGMALGVLAEPRTNWDAADLRYRGHLVEVKSSADHQAWKQAKPTAVQFGVAKKNWWDAETDRRSPVAERPASVYVFCHYRGAAVSEQVVDVHHWDFYPMATAVLNVELGDSQSIGLSRLRTLASPIGHTELRSALDDLLAGSDVG